MPEFTDHVPKPSRFLQRARALRGPSGILYVTIPNVDSLGRRILGSDWAAVGLRHVSYIRRESLARIASAAGLKRFSLTTRTPLVAASMHIWNRFTRGATPATDTAEQCAVTQKVRRQVPRSPLLERIKSALDLAVAPSSLGDTLVGVFYRQPR